MRAERRGIPGSVPADDAELPADAEADQDRGHDQAGNGEIEDQARAASTVAKGKAGRQRTSHLQQHDDEATHDRPAEGDLEIADTLLFGTLLDPADRYPTPRQLNTTHRTPD